MRQEPFNHGSVFTGLGGFDIAAEWMGWNNVFHCEKAEFPRRILQYRYPKAKSYHDIKETDFTIHRGTIDALTGGFPCQPYSHAGKRLGKEDDRHLWPEMLRAVRESQPKWVVGENVRGLINWNGGMVFDEVQADLEAEGYEVLPFLLPACAVNAPHRRDRIWFIAYRNSTGLQKERTEQQTAGITGSSIKRITTNTDSNGQHGSDSEHEEHTGEGRKYALDDTQPLIMHPDSDRLQRRRKEKIGENTERFTPTSNIQIPGWENFPTERPLCGRNDGFPYALDADALLDGRKPRNPWQPYNKWRQESIKAYGNAIVPQVALQIFKAIQAYENQLFSK